VTSPVEEFTDMPSGNGAILAFELTENVYGGAPPVATIVQPSYADPCVPAGHEVVVMVKEPPPPPPDVTVTVAVAVLEPAAFVAVRV
jgi:hypothetical protein